MADYLRSVRESPECIRCRERYAWAALEAGRCAEAMPVVGQALVRDDARRAELLLIAGRCAEAEGRLDAASAYYRRVLSTRRKVTDARGDLARLALRAGRPAEAYRWLEGNIRSSPARGDLELALQIAGTLGREGDRAELTARLALAAREERVLALTSAGMAELRAGRAHEAVRTFTEAVELSSGKPAARTGLGAALAAVGRGEEALAQFRSALSDAPDHAPAHFGEATVRARLGDAAGARRSLERCLEADPVGPYSDEAARLLATLPDW